MKYFLTLLLVLAGWASFAQEDWVEIKTENDRLTFKFPEKPIVQKKDLNGIQIQVYSYKDAATVYGVVASNFSQLGVDFSKIDPSDYYEEMKEGSLVRGNSILISERSVPYKRMLGKEIEYTQLVGNLEYTYYKRFFFRGKYVYQIAIGGPSKLKQLLNDKKNFFFNTFEFDN